ncbi:potassium channel family protein [Shewanella fidelis]|uniref:Potassium channel family protein n=1 Tax=Shewanella fidelis TaxID=173509 RepID=A0AAW8NNT3_9GAMM|nr:potassium channel family protein [Shewanella fidelis]MDR8523593.1 potassium channel family protein [Shewanella fidelis]MDW4810140.1 potassium channel family protein [Shewanella fidelis]MDW4814285.1 potassium channel family protein [Shewanella fidelis]MDW4818376.1 potassium channel family protein [Shewanella fidelis]MDW4823972.1 potassium channel family protein [Shewanella fidelis]
MQRKITKQNNFYYMTAALVVLLLSASLVKSVADGMLETFLEGTIAATFLVCVVSLGIDKSWKRFMQALIVIWLIAAVLKRYTDIAHIDLLMLGLMFAFFWGTFSSIARQILFSGSVNGNKIVGSIALFLLLGLMWALVYLLILALSPNAFSGIEQSAWGQNFSQMAYFSFVTLTTLGYGDISPNTPFAQVAVYMEAIAGVFYMAIVVASLVSAGLAQKETQ